MRKDMLVQLNCLRKILQLIEQTGFTENSKTLMVACDHWLYQLADFINIEQELGLNDFLQEEVNPYLESIQNNSRNSLFAMIQTYQDAIDEDHGDAYSEISKRE